ncbi:hypothetical protein ACFL1A_02980 [Patescibacteria group bacterium]
MFQKHPAIACLILVLSNIALFVSYFCTTEVNIPSGALILILILIESIVIIGILNFKHYDNDVHLVRLFIGSLLLGIVPNIIMIIIDAIFPFSIPLYFHVFVYGIVFSFAMRTGTLDLVKELGV